MAPVPRSSAESTPLRAGRRGLLAASLLGVLLAGCGDGGGSAGGGNAGTGGEGGALPPVTTLTISVTPSLGQVFSGTVRVIAPGGGGEEVSELARARTREDGSAALEVPADAEGPYLIEVSGNEDASYYDEGSDQTVPLTEDDVIRAVVLDLPADGLGVTPLTELACRYLEARHGKLAALTREQLRELFRSGEVEAAYARVRSELAPELGDTHLIAVPAVVGSRADLDALGTAAKDLYALKLAALAKVASLNDGGDRPALAMLRDLADDLVDGEFDGKHAGLPLVPASFDATTFAQQLNTAAQQLAGSDDLRQLVASFDRYVSSFIASLGGVAGGGGTGDAGAGDGSPAPLPALVPGALLSSWAGSYQGGWQVRQLEAYVKVPALTYPFYKWVRDPLTEESLRLSMMLKTFSGSGCNWTINPQSLQMGGLAIPFAPTLAAAATDESRRYVLPVSLSVLDVGVSAVTTLDTQGLLPTRIALDYHYKGLIKELRYSGVCTFTYKD